MTKTTDIQTLLANHLTEYADTLTTDPDIAEKLAAELHANQHVAEVQVSPVTSACWHIAATGWDGPLLSVCITPWRVSVVTEEQRVEWETLPQRFANEMGRNLKLMSS